MSIVDDNDGDGDQLLCKEEVALTFNLCIVWLLLLIFNDVGPS